MAFPRTWFGNWNGLFYGSAFGVVPGSNLRGVRIEAFPCEGPCCCRCELCKGIGYWSGLLATIPVPVAYTPPPVSPFVWGMETYWLGGPRTFGLCLNPGNANNCVDVIDGLPYGAPIGNGVGACQWNFSQLALPNPISSPPFGFWRVGISLTLDPLNPVYPDGMQLILAYQGASIDNSAISFQHVFNNRSQASGGWNCLGTGYFDFHSSSSSYPLGQIDVDFTGLSVYVTNDTPGPSVVWWQCGQNSDGSTYEPGEGFAAVMAVAGTGKTSVRTPLEIDRPDRCDHLGPRMTVKHGCNGWTQKHRCKLGLPAVPGGYCQRACESYEVDPDYAGQGVKGWLT